MVNVLSPRMNIVPSTALSLNWFTAERVHGNVVGHHGMGNRLVACEELSSFALKSNGALVSSLMESYRVV